jgi:hypothetical protein
MRALAIEEFGLVRRERNNATQREKELRDVRRAMQLLLLLLSSGWRISPPKEYGD